MRALGLILSLMMSMFMGFMGSEQYNDEFMFWWCWFYCVVFIATAVFFYILMLKEK